MVNDIFLLLIYNARRDATAEKEFDIVIQMTLERVLAYRFKKKNEQRKSNFQQRHLNVKKLVNCCGRIVYQEFILT